MARGPRSVLLSIILAIVPATALARGSEPPPGSAVDPLIRAGLGDLHQGLYGHAEERFRAAARAAPADPEPLLFVAFTHWWRIVLEHRGRTEGYEPFLRAIDDTVRTGEGRLDTAPGDRRAQAAVGAAHILRSHVEAMRKNFFQAAQEARRGKKLLESSLESNPGMSAALFPLGALNYYADRVPLLVKGLRFILFLPGGDADLGLSQLHRVAASDDYFRTDARLLLGLICASPEERCYAAGQAHLRKALEENPHSPLIAGAIGDLEVRLGEYGQAVRTFEESLSAMAGERDPERGRQRRWLRMALAEACVADWSLDRAADLLKEDGADPVELPAAFNKYRGRVQGELTAKRAIAIAAMNGNPGASGPIVNTLAARFLKGRALFIDGRFREAGEALEGAAQDMDASPPWLRGWTELYLGLSETRLGNGREARGHFKRASDVKRFRSAERGLWELDLDRSDPRCDM